MYGCEWDDQTGATNGFRQEGFDGEDFLFLDLQEMRWISPVQQGIPTVQKWNNNRAHLEARKHYFSSQCIESLKKYVKYGKSSLEKTSFYPSGVTITWMRNDQEHYEDVVVGELLPNEDGTFQKTSTITVTPDEWKNSKYSCVVEHQGTIKTASEIRTNPGAPDPFGLIFGVIAVAILLVIIAFVGFMVYRQQRVSKAGFLGCAFWTRERTVTVHPGVTALP
ncbi:MHC class I [Labeo rohita]|uniref:MHC class I n=1 Tax=Labeo rohita TaxID=84645 RepID=A0A498P068_LABRO|nr:MHC class I [Labeo rohita]